MRHGVFRIRRGLLLELCDAAWRVLAAVREDRPGIAGLTIGGIDLEGGVEVGEGVRVVVELGLDLSAGRQRIGVAGLDFQCGREVPIGEGEDFPALLPI